MLVFDRFSMDLPRRDFIRLGTLAGAQAALFRHGSDAAAVEGATPGAGGASLAALRGGFSAVPDAVKPVCYWWWFNGLVNQAGITRDLEEFRAKGLGGVPLVFTAGGLGGVQMPQGATFLSPE